MGEVVFMFSQRLGVCGFEFENLVCSALSGSAGLGRQELEDQRLASESHAVQRTMRLLFEEVCDAIYATYEQIPQHALVGHEGGAQVDPEHGQQARLFLDTLHAHLRESIRRRPIHRSDCCRADVVAARLCRLESVFEVAVDSKHIEKAFPRKHGEARESSLFMATVPAVARDFTTVGSLSLINTLESRLDVRASHKYCVELTMTLFNHMCNGPVTDDTLRDDHGEVLSQQVPRQDGLQPAALRRTLAYSSHKRHYDMSQLLNPPGPPCARLQAEGGRFHAPEAQSIMDLLENWRTEAIQPLRVEAETLRRHVSQLSRAGNGSDRESVKYMLCQYLTGVLECREATADELVGVLTNEGELIHMERVARTLFGDEAGSRQPPPAEESRRATILIGIATVTAGLLGIQAGRGGDAMEVQTLFEVLNGMGGHAGESSTLTAVGQRVVELQCVKAASVFNRLGRNLVDHLERVGIQGRIPNMVSAVGYCRGKGPSLNVTIPLASMADQSCHLVDAFKSLGMHFHDAVEDVGAACRERPLPASPPLPSDTHSLVSHTLSGLLRSAVDGWTGAQEGSATEGEQTTGLDAVVAKAQRVGKALNLAETQLIPKALRSLEQGQAQEHGQAQQQGHHPERGSAQGRQAPTTQGAANRGRGNSTGREAAPGGKGPDPDIGRAVHALFGFFWRRRQQVPVPSGTDLAGDTNAGQGETRRQLLLPFFRFHLVASAQSAIAAETGVRGPSSTLFSSLRPFTLAPIGHEGPRYITLDKQAIQDLLSAVCDQPMKPTLAAHGLVGTLFGDAAAQRLSRHSLHVNSLRTDGVTLQAIHCQHKGKGTTNTDSPHLNGDSSSLPAKEFRREIYQKQEAKEEQIVASLLAGKPQEVSGVTSMERCRHIMSDCRDKLHASRNSANAPRLPKISVVACDPGRAKLYSSNTFRTLDLGTLDELLSDNRAFPSDEDLFGNSKTADATAAQGSGSAEEETYYTSGRVLDSLFGEGEMMGIAPSSLSATTHDRLSGRLAFRRAEERHRRDTGADRGFALLSQFALTSPSPAILGAHMATRFSFPTELQKRRGALDEPRGFVTGGRPAGAELAAIRSTQYLALVQLSKEARAATQRGAAPVLAQEVRSLQDKCRLTSLTPRDCFTGQVCHIPQHGLFGIFRSYLFGVRYERLGPVRARKGTQEVCACAARAEAMKAMEDGDRGRRQPQPAPPPWLPWRQSALSPWPPAQANTKAGAAKKAPAPQAHRSAKGDEETGSTRKDDSTEGKGKDKTPKSSIAALRKAVCEHIEARPSGEGSGQRSGAAGESGPSGASNAPPGSSSQQPAPADRRACAEVGTGAAAGHRAGQHGRSMDAGADDDIIEGFASFCLGGNFNPMRPPALTDGSTRPGGSFRRYLGEKERGALAQQGTDAMRRRGVVLEQRAASVRRGCVHDASSVTSWDTWLESAAAAFSAEADIPRRPSARCDATGGGTHRVNTNTCRVAACCESIFTNRLRKLLFRYRNQQQAHHARTAKDLIGAGCWETREAVRAELEHAGAAGAGQGAGPPQPPRPTWLRGSYTAGRRQNERRVLALSLVCQILWLPTAEDAYLASAIAAKDDPGNIFKAVKDSFHEIRKKLKGQVMLPPPPGWRARGLPAVKGLSWRGYRNPDGAREDEDGGEEEREGPLLPAVFPAGKAGEEVHTIGTGAILAYIQKHHPKAHTAIMVQCSRARKSLRPLLLPLSTWAHYLAPESNEDKPQRDDRGKAARVPDKGAEARSAPAFPTAEETRGTPSSGGHAYAQESLPASDTPTGKRKQRKRGARPRSPTDMQPPGDRNEGPESPHLGEEHQPPKKPRRAGADASDANGEDDSGPQRGREGKHLNTGEEEGPRPATRGARAAPKRHRVKSKSAAAAPQGAADAAEASDSSDSTSAERPPRKKGAGGKGHGPGGGGGLEEGDIRAPPVGSTSPIRTARLSVMRVCTAIGATMECQDPIKTFQRTRRSEQAEKLAKAARDRCSDPADRAENERERTPVAAGFGRRHGPRPSGAARGRAALLVGLDEKQRKTQRKETANGDAETRLQYREGRADGTGRGDDVIMAELTDSARRRGRTELYRQGGWLDGRRARGRRFLTDHSRLRAEASFILARRSGSAHLAGLRFRSIYSMQRIG